MPKNKRPKSGLGALRAAYDEACRKYRVACKQGKADNIILKLEKEMNELQDAIMLAEELEMHNKRRVR